MNLKTNEYELLKKISSLLPAQSDFEKIPKEDQDIIVKFDALCSFLSEEVFYLCVF